MAVMRQLWARAGRALPTGIVGLVASALVVGGGISVARGATPSSSPILYDTTDSEALRAGLLRLARDRLGASLPQSAVRGLKVAPAGEPKKLLFEGFMLEEGGCRGTVPDNEIRATVQNLTLYAQTRQSGRAAAVQAELEGVLQAVPCVEPSRGAAYARDALVAVGSLWALRGEEGDAIRARDLMARALVMGAQPKEESGSAAVNGSVLAGRLELLPARTLEAVAVVPGGGLFWDGNPLTPGQGVAAVPGRHLLQIKGVDGEVSGAWVSVGAEAGVLWVADPQGFIAALPLPALSEPPRWAIVKAGLEGLMGGLGERRVLVGRQDGSLVMLDLVRSRGEVWVSEEGPGRRRRPQGWMSVGGSWGGLAQPQGGSLVVGDSGFANHSGGMSLEICGRIHRLFGLGVRGTFLISGVSGPLRIWGVVRPGFLIAPEGKGARPLVAIQGVFHSLPVDAESWGGGTWALGGGVAAGVEVPFRRGGPLWLRLMGEAGVSRDLGRGEVFVEMGGELGVTIQFAQ